jgi:hypothetical protein
MPKIHPGWIAASLAIGTVIVLGEMFPKTTKIIAYMLFNY